MTLHTPKSAPVAPSSRYAEIATAARACGLNISDDDFERIDDLIELNMDCVQGDEQ